MGLSSLASAHNLTRNKLWQKQSGRLRYTSTPPLPFPSSISLLPGCSLWLPAPPFPRSLWNSTLTSHDPRGPSNTKANFQSASTLLSEKIIVCLVISPTVQEINSGAGKEQQFAAGAPGPRRPYDPILLYQTLRRWAKPVSSASLSGYHPPTGRQTQDQGSSGKHGVQYSFGFNNYFDKI